MKNKLGKTIATLSTLVALNACGKNIPGKTFVEKQTKTNIESTIGDFSNDKKISPEIKEKLKHGYPLRMTLKNPEGATMGMYMVSIKLEDFEERVGENGLVGGVEAEMQGMTDYNGQINSGKIYAKGTYVGTAESLDGGNVYEITFTIDDNNQGLVGATLK